MFPNHPQQSRIQQCPTPLTEVEHTSAGVRVNLLHTLCYNSIAAQLANILHRFDKELRQQSEVHDNIHHFDIEDAPTHRSRLALLSTNDDPHEKYLVINVNVDWFQPYKHFITYSIGAIYASINNLPRQFRYQMENIMLVAVIPGPKEPIQMNSVMSLVVDELKDLQLGVRI